MDMMLSFFAGFYLTILQYHLIHGQAKRNKYTMTFKPTLQRVLIPQNKNYRNNFNNLVVKNIIKDLNLRVGEEKRMNCPQCYGYNCFGVKKGNGVYVYHCFRVSCKLKGKFSYIPQVKDLKERLMQSSVLKPNKEETSSTIESSSEEVTTGTTSSEFKIPGTLQSGICSSLALTWLKSNQAFEAYELGYYDVYTDLKDERIVIPLKNIDGKLVNAGGRALRKKTNPKFKLYSKNKVPPFVCGKGTSAVIVEDFASAASVSRINGLVGFALLGTNFNSEEHLPYLSEYKKIYVSLDPDATRISSDIQKFLSCVSLAEVRILFTRRDFKHYTKEELISFMEESNVIKKGSTSFKPEKTMVTVPSVKAFS